MPEPIARVRRLLPALAMLGDDGAWLAAALGTWLDGLTFEAALGLPASWRQDAARKARDDALRRIAGEHFGRIATTRGRALAIERAAMSLRASGADLEREASNSGLRADVAKLLLLATANPNLHRDALPGERQLCTILAAEVGSRGGIPISNFRDGMALDPVAACQGTAENRHNEFFDERGTAS